MRFDLIVKGAHVIDPANRINGRRDVAVRRGRVAAIDTSIPSDSAAEVHNATNRYLTPGLVDLHTHVYPGATFWGVNPDTVAPTTGVTTFVDAGSAGALNFDGFRETVIDRADVTVRSLLNISCIGLTAHDYELTNLEFCDPALFELIVNGNRDVIVGGKVRMGVTTLGKSGIEPMQRARQALDRCDLPLMVHISTAPPDPAEFQHLLRRGDVVTHCCTGQSMKLIADDGSLRPFAKDWQERGVLFDVGHGTGSFVFTVAEALAAAGLVPDFISSDVHQNSINGPMYDLPTCLTKWLEIGMDLYEVIQRATANPARFLGMESEAGTLAVGSPADFALFNLLDGGPTLYDSAWNARAPRRSLAHVSTYLKGRCLPPPTQPHPPLFLSWGRAGRDDALFARQAAARIDGTR